jgi:serine/threonine protein kinase
VYRSYDSRVNRTPRRPDFYLSENHAKVRAAENLFPWLKSVKIIYDHKDEHVLPMDAIIDLGISNRDPVRMLNFIGQVQIISVPYIDGTHMPTNTFQLAAIGSQLQYMHQIEWKHGDLRLCNMVFTRNKDEAYLIDFDFSGKGNIRYPPNFAEYLPDAGLRPVADKGGVISAVDDVIVYFRILTMLEQEGGTDPAAFYNTMKLIKRHYDAYIELVEQIRVQNGYKSTEYDKNVDKFECKHSVSFLAEAIRLLRCASVDLVVTDKTLRAFLHRHDVRNREIMLTMPVDTKTPERFV